MGVRKKRRRSGLAGMQGMRIWDPRGMERRTATMAIEEHEELTWRILKCAFHVQNTLGCGFLEKVYENAMMIALRKEGLQAEQQVPMQVYYEGLIVGEYVADILVEKTVIVEIKATEDTPAFFKAQVLNYTESNESIDWPAGEFRQVET
jgi:GxxExxY protein